MRDLKVESIEIDGGGLILTARNRPETKSNSARRQRESARIITAVWGERYVNDLLSVTIPALLAPGNLPAFAPHFDCQFVIVTETRQFDLIAHSPVVARLLRHCDVRLLPIDDLLSSWYGITLTFAFVRGFADLGSAMVNTYLVFINADFVIADGSYAKLAEMILQGERLIVSPSYCMITEETIDPLLGRFEPGTCSISISRRELASLILEHRHNTIRAKTVNQKLFRMHRHEQFFWSVDEQTLLGRQMPISVICMRPERVILEMPTFWDYGVISEYCPTLRPCVLGDSDDFLMGELRTRGTFQEFLRLGWPTVEEIAADLSSFTTKDHRDYGRHTLVLHSRDLPAELGDHKARFHRFVDSVYDRLSPPISYRDHPFWAGSFPQFQAMRAEQGRKLQVRHRAKAELSGDPLETARRKRLEEIAERTMTIAGECGAVEKAIAQRDRATGEEIAAIEDRCRRDKEAVSQARANSDRGEADRHARLLSQRAALERERLTITEESGAAIDRLAREIEPDAFARLGVEPDPGAKSVGRRSGTAPAVEETASNGTAAAPETKFHWLEACGRLYRRIFGRVMRTTVWHPYHAVVRHLDEAVSACGEQVSDVLIVSSGGSLGSHVVDRLAARKTVLSPGMVLSKEYSRRILDGRQIGLCVCDLSVEDLLRFKEIFERFRPYISPGGQIVVFHHNQWLRNLNEWTAAFAERLFPHLGNVEIRFAGSAAGALAMRGFVWILSRCDLSRVSGFIVGVAILACCAPLARIASAIETRRDPSVLPARCTSMTIAFKLS